MKSNLLHFLALRRFSALAVVVAMFGPSPSQAQQIFRIVGPDGKVTFSDRPPPASANNTQTSETTTRTGGSTDSAGLAALPYELRQAALKYPVVIYTADNCAPCGAGRSLLTSRGIPYTEKTIATAQDKVALQSLSGEMSLPFLTIGGQHFRGFVSAQWTQFLTAAGYPQSSVLPASYRPRAPAPLATLTADPPAQAASAETTLNSPPAAPPVSPPAAGGANPAGTKY